MSVRKIQIINGPNLNLLGTREPQIYGNQTLDQILTETSNYAKTKGFDLSCFQSNHEGEIIDQLQQLQTEVVAVVINPGALTHTSIAIRDAISAISPPVVEVHLSNIYSREEFRRHSIISPVVKGSICGFGSAGYLLAIDAIASILR